MVERANGGMNSDVDVTVDVNDEMISKTEQRLAALMDDPSVKGDRGERAVLDSVASAVESTISEANSVVSAVESTISTVESTISTVESTISTIDSTISAATASEKNYDIEDNLYRAAVHQGWDDDQIKTFMQLDPDRARATFQKMYESTNKMSQVWANAGRAELLQDIKEQPKEKDKLKTEFKGLDIEKLKQEYDNDPVIELVADQQAQNKILFDMVQDLQDTISTRREVVPQNQQAGAEAAAIVQQIDAFFKQDDMKLYNDFYGSGDNLTPGQMANRNAAFALADQIRAGRALQKLDTSVEEALIQAHLLVSEPIREKMVRTNIVSQLKKRSKGLSLKPGSKGRDVNAEEFTKPQNNQDIEDNVTKRLSKISW